ncbi:MAG TPA: hypothetical protein VMS64_31700 [Candidatus Methylomirabilis sp.]|nr:hypothetical protein [Candidatus Methylomirabilis sp.]
MTTGPPLYCRDAFELFSVAFERLAQEFGAQLTDVDIALAGRRVRARILGAELGRMFLEAFELSPGGGQPALEIWLWDESPDTGIDARVRLECGLDEQALRASVVTGVSESGRYVCNAAQSWLNFLDLERSRIVGCVLSRAGLGIHERARPFEWPLRFWLRRLGLPVVHAGLVASDGAGVLIAGPAGAGKSTVALACVDGGLDYLADDKVGLEAVGAGAYVGHRLYRSILASVDVLDRFPHLVSHARRRDDDEEAKAILMVSELYPRRVARSCRIEAIVLPRLDAGLTAPRLERARRAEAATRIFPNCLPLYPTWDRDDFVRLADLVQSVPVFWLEVGGPPAALPALIESAARRSP